MESKNYELGLRVQKLLQDNNLENPLHDEVIARWSDPKYVNVIQEKLADFLQVLGLNLTDKSMANTPKRVVKFFINELFYGLDYRNFPKISLTPNVFKYHTPLISQAITVNSTCEHHLVSIRGRAIIAYIPKDVIVGLSKLNRVVDFFASRPQVQERMTRQMFVVLQDILETEDVAISINASHNCIVIRGVKDHDSETLTMELGGQFLQDTILKDNFCKMAMSMK
jgi:GTP cyclohydrolase I